MVEVDPVFEQPGSEIGWPANSSIRYEAWRVPTMIIVYFMSMLEIKYEAE